MAGLAKNSFPLKVDVRVYFYPGEYQFCKNQATWQKLEKSDHSQIFRLQFVFVFTPFYVCRIII